MTTARTTPDVCIVGMGAAGATAAHALAEAGMNVLVLEAGRHIDDRDARPDELQATYIRGMGHKFNQELQTWRPSPDAETGPATYSLGKMVNGVGGGTQIYGTWMRRYTPNDFRVRTATLERYGPEAIPPGANPADWPVTYDDLEPFYCRVEQVMGVGGDPSLNPFEGPRSQPLPLPPPRRTPTGQMFTEAARRLGYHPFPVPATINSQPFDGRPACTYCGWCTFYVCHNGSKSHAGNTVARRALESGRVELRTGCRVTKLNKGADGRMLSVDYLDPDGRLITQPADRFVLATYTFENVRLLLTSGIGGPNVGKWFMTKMYASVMGLFPGQRLNRFVAPAACGDIMDDFVGDNFDHAGLGFLRGATISCEEQLQPIAAARAALPEGVPSWGRGYKEWLLSSWNSVADLRIQPETLPYEDTFLDLDPRQRDRSGLGLPVVRITWDIHENERRLISFLDEKARAILAEMGASRVWAGPRFTGAGSAHDLGGCRMGEDPRTSIVDPTLRVWDTPNLYVYGGAVFPTGGGINPTLTIQALVWRAAAQLAATR